VILFALAFPPEPAPRARVLLVEDHQDTRQMYAEYLRLSFDVEEAADAAEALRLAAARHPDVVVTDVSLPGMDGYELIARLRGAAATRAVPVITLSGYGSDLDARRPAGAHPDRSLLKPCLPDALQAAIAELLTGPRRKSLR
jgi:CheY-like chemotaxis protein